MTNNTQFTRKDVEKYLKRMGDSYYAQGLLEDGQAMLQAILSDMDSTREALNNIHKTTEDQEASELAFDALKLCAKWRVV